MTHDKPPFPPCRCCSRTLTGNPRCLYCNADVTAQLRRHQEFCRRLADDDAAWQDHRQDQRQHHQASRGLA